MTDDVPSSDTLSERRDDFLRQAKRGLPVPEDEYEIIDDAIEALAQREEQVERLETALEHFANLENWWPEYPTDNEDLVHAWDGHYLTDEPWTLAQDALTEEEPEDGDA